MAGNRRIGLLRKGYREMKPPRRHYPMTEARKREMEREGEAQAIAAGVVANLVDECWECGGRDHTEEQCPKRKQVKPTPPAPFNPMEELRREQKAENLSLKLFEKGVRSSEVESIGDSPEFWGAAASLAECNPPRSDKARALVIQKLKKLEALQSLERTNKSE